MTPLLRLAAFLCLVLDACGGGTVPTPAPGVGTTIDPLAYLAQSRACDGNPMTPLHQGDPITCRRFDFGHFQAEDAFLLLDGSTELAWSYPPFGAYDPANGDGGEHYIINGGTVTIAGTRDGGKPYDQQFCGGSGWVAFKTDASSGWRYLVATLGDAPAGQNCVPGSLAFTRYKKATVAYPGLGPVDTIVSEHYSGPDVDTASAMERSFFGRGWGRLAWQAWGPDPATIDLSARCPDFGWSTPPVPGWFLDDCRIAVDVTAADGSLSGAAEWPP